MHMRLRLMYAIIWCILSTVLLIILITPHSQGPEWPLDAYEFHDVVTDGRIIDFIRRNVLILPGNDVERVVLDNISLAEDPSEGQFTSTWIVPVLFSNLPRKGSFFEAGALDGKTLSTTYYLEQLGWTGMLAEMTPINIPLILENKRSTILAPVCLSPDPWPKKLEMHMRYDPNSTVTRWGGSVAQNGAWEKTNPSLEGYRDMAATVPCYPLSSLLLAANMPTIDFFSLDLEGLELKVLKTIKWDLHDIKVIHMDLQHTHEGVFETVRYLSTKGFEHVYGSNEPVVFVKRDYLKFLLRAQMIPTDLLGL